MQIHPSCSVADVVTSKAIAMRDGLKFANFLGFSRVVAESDSLIVIDFYTGQSRWWDAATTVFTECVDDIASLIRSNLNIVSI